MSPTISSKCEISNNSYKNFEISFLNHTSREKFNGLFSLYVREMYVDEVRSGVFYGYLFQRPLHSRVTFFFFHILWYLLSIVLLSP